MSRSELRFQTVEALGEAYRSGELSPVDVAQAHLDAIEALNPDTHDYITVTAVRAIADARRSEDALRSGQDVGPLCGVPIALKDLVHTAGIPTTAGTTIWHVEQMWSGMWTISGFPSGPEVRSGASSQLVAAPIAAV